MRGSILTAALLALAGCDAGSLYACTDDYRAVTVRVVAPDGQLLTGLDAVSVHERTGAPLPSSEHGSPLLGAAYVVASDGDLGVLRTQGDRVRFSASGDGVVASATFVIADDGCHVRKEDGPEAVVAVAL